MVQFERPESRNALLVALAPPRPVSKPQRVCMSRTPWPHGVDESIVDVLLRIVHDTLKVTLEVFDELSEPDRVPLGQIVVTTAHCCVQISHKELHNPRLVEIGNQHK
jgi:hypothetical protein